MPARACSGSSVDIQENSLATKHAKLQIAGHRLFALKTKVFDFSRNPFAGESGPKKNDNKDEMATLVEAGFRWAISKDIHQLRKS
jgi:hypothetical protein